MRHRLGPSVRPGANEAGFWVLDKAWHRKPQGWSEVPCTLQRTGVTHAGAFPKGREHLHDLKKLLDPSSCLTPGSSPKQPFELHFASQKSQSGSQYHS